MVFVREVDETSINAFGLEDAVQLKALIDRDAVVLLSVDDERRRLVAAIVE
jgi:hypothetical protein